MLTINILKIAYYKNYFYIINLNYDLLLEEEIC